MGFNRPSKIQEKALPLLLADPPHNVIAQSQSGTGKTAAFVLAMLSRVDPSKQYPQVCVCVCVLVQATVLIFFGNSLTGIYNIVECVANSLLVYTNRKLKLHM